jgi:ubiquitin-conjugating enzyme E2 O
MRVGERVRFKDPTRPPFTKHGDENGANTSLIVRTLTVKETRTTINILWQDGTAETYDSKELIPYLNPDEYDCWYCATEILRSLSLC